MMFCPLIPQLMKPSPLILIHRHGVQSTGGWEPRSTRTRKPWGALQKKAVGAAGHGRSWRGAGGPVRCGHPLPGAGSQEGVPALRPRHLSADPERPENVAGQKRLSSWHWQRGWPCCKLQTSPSFSTSEKWQILHPGLCFVIFTNVFLHIHCILPSFMQRHKPENGLRLV